VTVVLAYHGCNVEAARALLSGSPFKPSNKPYDWLGSGAYFWERDPLRAYEWALERRPHQPCVVGAAIELGNCLDLTTRSGIQAVRVAHDSYLALQEEENHRPVLRNQPAKSGRPSDLIIRYLDNAIIDHLHQSYKRASDLSGGRIREFDTVRALFPEGEPLYENAGFLEKTHVQIAVKKPEQVLGVFRIPAYKLRELGMPEIYAS
jgi:hypothetical protein